MIVDDLEYQVLKRNITGFEANLARLDESYAGQSEAAKQAARFEFQQELNKLRAELAEYERRERERWSA